MIDRKNLLRTAASIFNTEDWWIAEEDGNGRGREGGIKKIQKNLSLEG